MQNMYAIVFPKGGEELSGIIVFLVSIVLYPFYDLMR